MYTPIPVEDLRVGMFIRLKGGWLSHPFPLSSFRIGSAEQIATICGLGLAQVEWAPEKSDPEPGAPGPEDAGAAGSPSAHDAGAEGAQVVAAAAPADSADADADAARAEAALGLSELSERTQALAHQHETLARCERRHADAARTWRMAQDAVTSHPVRSREAAEALTAGMLQEMAEAGDIGIRLLAGHQGDRAAAHALNVGVISLLIGRSFGLEDGTMRDLGVGALLHDIGKIDLPERVRHADPHHGPSELSAYREHVSRGLVYGRRMGLREGALQVLVQHHEHTDGSGFPGGLQGDAMSLAARIVAIVNRYDNLCNPPLSQRPLTPHEAVSMLFAQGRGSYDRTVLAGFIRMMGVYPAGSLVQLTDDRYAMVMSVNSSRPLKPRVLVHDEAVPREQALVLNLESAPDLGIRRSLPPARVPPLALRYLDPRPRVSYYFEPLTPRAPDPEPSAEADAGLSRPAALRA